MNIKCYLISNGEFKAVEIEEKLLLDLVKSLRYKGIETVHFSESSIDVEGVYIPAKESKATFMILPNTNTE
ncbi:hypothetical protein [Petroclostridium sp. X23]|uniref:hypothetical protein n=1 Tax=Petroclostridium sp. X23 TaxID=3045146 RepID=UPI0024AD5222|nr:hypothetical protein [Petroclostridium sp. X23]WHH58459.1 hypothetical protein QKW49_22100 [Petroclostridium sp. X23]